MEKDFDGWNEVKKRLHYSHRLPTYKQQEIWWCSLGVNIGHEEDGKNDLKHRPVLIIRKFNQHIFLGLPLTTQTKDNKYYFPLAFKGKTQHAMLSQISVWDAHRLDRLMGTVSDAEYNRVRIAVKDMI